MYEWRKISDTERAELLRQRKGRRLPWHRPPHFEFTGPVTFFLTASCFEHTHIIGRTAVRMFDFESEILRTCDTSGAKVFAWCVLPNHYHILARTEDIRHLRREIGKSHGRTARRWNQEDDEVGRKVWFNYFDREMKSPGHYWASLNYIQNNPVHHGYVERWQDWPFSSAKKYLESVGHEEAVRIWREFPVLDYGKGWDD